MHSSATLFHRLHGLPRRSGRLRWCWAALLAATPLLQAQPLDYAQQQEWPAARGQAQSPIDIATADARQADPREPLALQFSRTRAPLTVVDNQHAIEVEAHGPEARIRGRHFRLAQFHFHADSEHTLDGRHFPLEGHFVFKAADGRLAVIAVLYQPGQANALAGRLLDALDDQRTTPPLDILGLLPRRRGYYHYLGSLTTPPLTENVEWYVLPQPVSLSAAQLARFRARYENNRRAVQPMNDRPLLRASVPASP